MAVRVRVFIACSLDGFIAGPGDDLSWLPGSDGGAADEDGEHFGYAAFIAEVGALLMGRRTCDIVAGFAGDWPYGELPVLVASHRALVPKATTGRVVSGTIGEVLSLARAAAGGKDVYVDGGDLIRQALEAGQLDELCVTIVPVILGHALRCSLACRATTRSNWCAASSSPGGWCS